MEIAAHGRSVHSPTLSGSSRHTLHPATTLLTAGSPQLQWPHEKSHDAYVAPDPVSGAEELGEKNANTMTDTCMPLGA